MAGERDAFLERLRSDEQWWQVEDAIPELYQDDEEIVAVAVSINGAWLRYASERLRDNYQIVLSACRNGGRGREYRGIHDSVPPLQFASEPLRADRAVVLASVRRDGFALQYASLALRDDLEVVTVAVKEGSQWVGMEQDVPALQFASGRFRDDRELVLHAIREGTVTLPFASDRLRDEHDVVVEAVNLDPRQFEYASQRLRTSPAMNLLAISNDTGPYTSFHLPRGFHRALLSNRDFVLDAVRKNFGVFGEVDETLRGDREIALAAIAQDGSALQFASRTLRSDPKVCCAAVATNPSAIKFTLESSSAESTAPNLHHSTALAFAHGLNPGVQSLCDHMLSMYLEGLCTDVRVVLDDGSVLAAHRAVLASRSPVLKAQFTNGMFETKGADLHICGCSEVAADRFLRFLYSGMLDGTGISRDTLQELRTLADYYDVPDLLQETQRLLRPRVRMRRREC